MVRDALEGDRFIGMALLKPGYEAGYAGRPPVYAVGCAGVITHAARLGDGRYNIVLRGIGKFSITGEDQSRAYRLAEVDAIPETLDDGARRTLQTQRIRLEALLAAMTERAAGEPRFPPAMPDDDLVNALSQHLELEPIERQALLECDGVPARCRALIELVEMKLLAPGGHWNEGASH